MVRHGGLACDNWRKRIELTSLQHFLQAFIETSLPHKRKSQIAMGYCQTRAEFDGTAQLSITKLEIGWSECDVGYTKCGVSFGQILINGYGFARGLFRFSRAVDRCDVAVSTQIRISVSKTRVGERIVAIFLYCPLVVAYGG